MKKIIQLSLLAVVSTFFLSGLAAAQQGTDCADTDYECKITANTDRINTNSKDAEAYYNLGVAYNKLEKYTQAIAVLNKYIALKPTNKEFLGDGYFERGYAYLSNNTLDSALTDYNAGMLLNSKNASAYINRGLVYLRKNDFPKATADFMQAKKVNPNNPEAYYNLGLVFERKSEFAKAIAEFDKYILMNTDNQEYLADGYFARGRSYFSLNNNAKAIKDLTAAIGIFPDKASFYTTRAKVYRKQGNVELAEADEQEAASLAR